MNAEQLEAMRRLVAAKKLAIATAMRAGEDVPAAELDRIARLETRLATAGQFLRLRELTRQPDLALPVVEVAVDRATATKRKGSRAKRTQTKAD